VDCLGNHGGYFVCSRYQGFGLWREKKQAQSPSQWEANCRDMSCTTLEGLLQRETIAKKGKNINLRPHGDSLLSHSTWCPSLVFDSSVPVWSRYRNGKSCFGRMGTLWGSTTDRVPKSHSTICWTGFGRRGFMMTPHYYTEQGIFHPVKSMDSKKLSFVWTK
jgi:hypothetical protein